MVQVRSNAGMMGDQGMAGGAGKGTTKGITDETLEETKKNNIIETQNDQDVLTQAKDRAQLTSSTAMSVINVALLREIIDSGHDNTRYYTASVVIISVALALQILAGILSIVVSNMVSYRNEFKTNMCADVCDNLFPCQCRKVKKNGSNGTPGNTASTSKGHGDRSIDVETDVGCCGCCPFDVTSQVYPEFEYNIINMHHDYKHDVITDNITAIEAAAELKYQESVAADSNKRIAEIEKDLQAPTLDKDTEQLLNGNLASLQTSLAAAKTRQDEFEAQLRKNEITKAKAQLIKEHAENFRKKRSLKRVAFWQNVINFLLYAVFILNAFVVGFGIARTAEKGTLGNTGAGTNATLLRDA